MSIYVNIEKAIGNFHLDVEFESGNETLAVFGASGCGKSMTLKCIAGIVTPDRGKIVVEGRTLFDSEKGINLSPQKRSVGYLFQSYALFPNMTVEQNIAVGIKDASSAQIKSKVQEYIRIFHLEGLGKRFPTQLSGGQKQRVALARIMASSPTTLMLDEPFSALDDYLKWQLEQELMNILDGYGKTVLLVSHNRGEVYRLCDRIGIIVDGKMQPVEDKEELFEYPKTRTAALLTGCKNLSSIEKLGEYRVKALDWGVELVTAQPVGDDINFIGIHSHSMRQAEVWDGNTSEENVILCNCSRKIPTSWSVLFLLDPESGGVRNSKLRMELTTRRAGRITDNGSIKVWLPKDKLMLLR